VPSASDNCSGATVACSPAPGSTFSIGVTSVTCTATDAAGNSSQCAFSVTVTDATGPALACPANVVVPAAAGACAASVGYTLPSASDACSGLAGVSCSPASGSTFPVGVTTVTCTALDTANNASVCSFTVTVVDQEAPTVTCPGALTAAATSSSGAIVNFATPAGTDNCGGTVVVACAPASGTAFPVGVTTVTCTATDASNNTASCSFAVTVSLISNGGFEAGVSPWVQKQSGLINNSSAQPANSGAWKAQLLGTGATANHYVYQVPPFSSTPTTRTLRFYMKIISSEGTAVANDKMGARIFNSADKEILVLQLFSNVDQVTYANYQLVTLTIPAQYAVQGNRIRFGGSENNNGLPTTFLIDDVSVY
jgi:hypothetical protein